MAPGRARPEVTWADIRVRPFQQLDIQAWVTYLFHSPRSTPFLQQLSLAQLPSEDDYRSQLHQVAQNFSKFPWLAIEAKNQVVGLHFLTDVTETTADFQAHIWNTEFRGKGVGVISWFKACAYFFENFKHIETIFFRFPGGDSGVKRFASKLPLSKVGEAPLRNALYREGQIGVVMKIDRTDFDNLQRGNNDFDEEDED